LGIETGSADLGEVLLGRQHLSQAVISADQAAEGKPRPNLWLLPSSDNLESAKDTLRRHAFALLAEQPESANHALLGLLEQRLSLALGHFAYIILDCPPTLDAFTQAVYHFADAAIVPVKPDYFSTTGVSQPIGDIRNAQLRGIEIRIHTIVPTFYVERQRLDAEMVATLHKLHGDLVSEPIPRSQAVAEAPAYRQTIFEFDPHLQNPATIAYQKLVDKVYYG
jgi:chromosome partitioning protein